MIELIFVVDPMCSWCWGFHPVIEKLRKEHNGRCTFSLVVGGLRSKGQMVWNEENRNYLRHHWNAVSKKTGQPFVPSILNRTHFEYDTYPACKAVVTVRELWGNEEAFKYLAKIQYAFYAEGKDITSKAVLWSYVTQDKELFSNFYQSPRAEILMQNDFSKARVMGANAFPSVVKIDEDGHMVCKKGYQSIEEILNN